MEPSESANCAMACRISHRPMAASAVRARGPSPTSAMQPHSKMSAAPLPFAPKEEKEWQAPRAEVPKSTHAP
eukprot:scaffold18205_cov29-Tisochrysis_lutea.AAC.6